MTRFTKGLLSLPLHWKGWLLLIFAVNGVVPLFFLGHREAIVVLVVFAAAGVTMGLLTAKYGFARILGVGHFYWFGLVPYLVSRLGHFPVDTDIGKWLRALIVVNCISLAIDVVDVARWIRGERGETDLR